MVYNRIAYDETYRKIGENPRESWRMVPDNHPAIISWKLFDEVSTLREDEQAVKEERKKWCRQRRKNNPNIFKGRIFCKKCGEKLVCHWQSDGTLYFYCVLANVEEQAAERYEVLIEQLSRREDVSEKLKEENQMEWVRRMRNLENRAAEIVKAELIYTFERR